MFNRIRIVCAIFILSLGALVSAQTDDIPLVEWSSEAFGLTGLAPEGWTEASPGVWLRQNEATDPTLLAMQAVDAAASAVVQSVLPQMGISALPEPVDPVVTEAFSFEVYVIENAVPGVGDLKQDFAISEDNGRTTILWLATLATDYDALHAGVFLPALDALSPLASDADDDTNNEAPPGDVDPVTVAQTWVDLLVAGDFAAAEAMFSSELMAALPQSLEQLYTENIAVYGEIVEIRPPREDPSPGTIIVTLMQDDNAFDLHITSDDSGEIVGLFLRTSPARYSRAEGAPMALTETMLADFDAFVDEAYTRFDVPGTAVAVVHGDEIVFARGYGVKAVGGDEPVTSQTLFPVGSVSKSINSAFLATLVSDNVIEWDTLVAEIAPDFALSDAELTASLRIRDLLGNSYGLQRNDFTWIDTRTTVDQALGTLAEQAFDTRPGEFFGYNNQMVAAGGYFGALANGGDADDLFGSYAAQVDARIFEPIGMTTATLDREAALAQGDTATGHTPYLSDNALHPLDFLDISAVAPAGGVYASVEDMAKFLGVMLNEGVALNGTRVVDADALRETWTPQIELSVNNIELAVTPMSAPVYYGMGWFIEDFRGVEIIQHAGNLDYASASIHLIPEADLGIAVLHNRLGASDFTYNVAYRLIEMVYGLEHEADALFENHRAATADRLAATAAQVIIPADIEPALDYLGAYSYGAELEVRDADELWLTFGEREYHLIQISGVPGYFADSGLLYGQQVTFRENADGSVSIILGGALEIAASDPD